MKRLFLICALFTTAALAANGGDEASQINSPDGQFIAAARRIPDRDYIWKRDLDGFRLVIVRWDDADGADDILANREVASHQVAKMKWSPDSKFIVMTTTSSGGHSPWQFATFVFSIADKTLHRLERLTVVNPDFHFEGPDTVVLELLNEGHEIGEPGDRKTAKLRLPELIKKQ